MSSSGSNTKDKASIGSGCMVACNIKGKGKEEVVENPNYPLWSHVEKLGRLPGGGNWDLRCTHCKLEFKGSYTRVKSHLLGLTGAGVKPCQGIDDPTLAELLRMNDESHIRRAHQTKVPARLPNSESYSVKKRKGNNQLAKSSNFSVRDTLDHLIARYFYANGVPFFHIRSPFFKEMIQFACDNNLKGYTPPNYNRLRTSLLDAEKATIENCLKSIKASWGTRGVSVVSYGWTDIARNPLINFIAASDAGPVFLKAIDVSGNAKNTDYMARLFLEVVAEIGPSNVVQIITDNAAICRAAGIRVQATHSHIFWTPCVVHTLDLALRNMCAIEKERKNAERYPLSQWMRELDKDVKLIRNFIVDHSYALTIYCKYAGLRLLGVAETRFASTIIMIKRVKQVKDSLCRMVIHADWKFLKEQDVEKSQRIKDCLLDGEWWDRVDYFLELTDPIFSMLRACATDAPMLHLVYDMWDSMIEKMKAIIFRKEGKNIMEDESEFYNEMHSILVARWDRSSTPIHCMAHSLNPKYYSDEWLSEAPGRISPHQDIEISDERNSCFNRLFPNPSDLRQVHEEFGLFSSATGYYGGWEPLSERYTTSPKSWWANHGAHTPFLAKLANRVLGQPCSSSCCGRNWSTYELIKNVKRNKLISQRADDLVFVHSNLRLISRRQPGYEEGPCSLWDTVADDIDFDVPIELDIHNLSLDDPLIDPALEFQVDDDDDE